MVFLCLCISYVSIVTRISLEGAGKARANDGSKNQRDLLVIHSSAISAAEKLSPPVGALC